MGNVSKTELKLKAGFLGFQQSSISNLVNLIDGASFVSVEPVIWQTSDLDITSLLSEVNIVLVSSLIDQGELELWLQTIRHHDSTIPILLIMEGPLSEQTRQLVSSYDCLLVSEDQPSDLLISEIGDVLASAFILKSLMENFEAVSSWGIWGGSYC